MVSFLCEQSDPALQLRDYLAHHPHAASSDVVAALAHVGARVNVRMVDYVRQFVPAIDADSVCGQGEDTVLM